MPFVDFHTHTTTSDGVWTPDQLFDYMRTNEVEYFSLTDHDTMDAYPLPADLLDRSIPGMEVDTKCNGVTSHLLVYGLRSKDAPLLEFLRKQREARRVRMQEMLERLHGMGINVSMADVEAQATGASSLGRPHLGRALVALGVVSELQEAFDKYLADDQDGYVSLDRLDSAACVDLAHQSGAIVSVAHPCRLKAPASLEALLDAGVDGIEAVHPSADESAQAELRAFARDHGLLVTGGSDFHAPSAGYAPGITTLSADEVARLLEAVGTAAV